MNAIHLLEQQHEQVKSSLEAMAESDMVGPAELRLLADELVAHMVIEEHVFYPRVKEIDGEIVSESFEEHAVARFALARLLTAPQEEQATRARVLLELIRHHVGAEEEEMFPEVERRIPEQELERLGERMEMMFEKAVEVGFERLVTPVDQSLRASNGGARATARSSKSRRVQRTTRPSSPRQRANARS